jgi:hypothetical protein
MLAPPVCSRNSIIQKSCEIRVQNAGKAMKEVHYNYQDWAQVTETSTLHES